MIKPIIFVLISCFFLIISHSANTSITDNHKLVYTRCSNRSLSTPSHASLLTNLSQAFIAQSSKSSFFQTIVADEKTAISGSYQCTNDLTSDECRSCVSRFSDLSQNSCGSNLPARIQLQGCYARYEEENGDGDDHDHDQPETNTEPDQILHKACSKKRIKKSGFEEMKFAAFAALESGVMSENGFCEMTHESIHVVAQCNGRLGNTCDCGGCVNDAVQIAEEDECRYSVSGEIYLDGCFISYDYRDDGEFGSYKDKNRGDSSAKLVAYVVGGLVALALGIGFCNYFTRGKKKEDW